MLDQQGFVLTRRWRDTRAGIELEFWLATDDGPYRLLIPSQQAVFFIPHAQRDAVDQLLSIFNDWSCKQTTLQSFSMQPVLAYYFKSQRSLRAARELLLARGISPLESDINPYDRFLMERYVRGSVRFRGPKKYHGRFSSIEPAEMVTSDYQPQLKVLSLDIETAMESLSLYSIGVYSQHGEYEFRKVFLVADQPLSDEVEIFADDKALLVRFLDWLASYDPDIIIGWNVINFDMWYLARLCKKYALPFRCGRNNSNAHWRSLDDEGERRALSIPGRVVLDGIELLKAATYRFESFSLNFVAGALLNEEKLVAGNDRGEKITDLFLTDKLRLVDYNLQDCKLVWDIFDHTHLLDFAIARTRITGLPLDRIGGSVASFDFRYLPLLHRQGFVAPNGHWLEETENSPGGFVMDSQPGIYDFVAVLDFKSLYPGIIRSFKIDPMGMAIGLNNNLDQINLVPGFKGAWFAKEKNLLPNIIQELWETRDQAKEDKDIPLSQAIKIIMNSFYGVLGSGGCRFFDARLASSITQRGHQIIQQTAAFIERQGWSVIYGDTDSVFVWFKDATDEAAAITMGRNLASKLNYWWRQKLAKEYGVDSVLEIEFETLYQRFLMPTVRGSDQGSKKRYAGVVKKNNQLELVFKGLENVRTDWTRLARDFQLELYRRVFFDQPYRDYIKQIVRQVLAGELDQQLIYRKRVRRKLMDYQRNIPPHVQAAKKADARGIKIRRGDWIDYVITLNGAEPAMAGHAPFDYQHYIDRQLAPVADGVLYFFGESLANIIDQQIGLFD